MSVCFLENIIKKSDFLGCYLNINFTDVLLKSLNSDLRRKKKKEISIYDGFLISLKDNIITKDLTTTAASKMLENFFPSYNATVVEKMVNLGIIILGKLNSDEFGMGSTNENSGYKICKSPKNYLYSPGGSSGGCSSSVVSNLSLCSLGSDTGGSVRLPASYLNCLGYKPSYGTISRFGLISFSDSLDTIGMICKNIFDIFIILKIIKGVDDNDLNTINKNIIFNVKNNNGYKILFPINYINFLSNNILKNNFFFLVKKIKLLNIAKIFYSNFPFYLFFLYIYYINSSVEAYSNLSRYGNNQFSKVLNNSESNFFKNRSLFFGREVKKRILIGNYFLINKNGNKFYKKSFILKDVLFNFFLTLFKKIDFIFLPSIIDFQLLLGEKSSKNCVYLQDSFTVISSICGFPTMSLNLNNFSFENSFSFQILANLYNDYKLLKFYSYIKKKDIFNF